MKELNELESNFLATLQEFTAGNDSVRAKLFVGYNKLIGSINDAPDKRDQKLSFVFSALIEHLDKAPDGETARTLYAYTFGDFLECYCEEPVIRTKIKDYLDHNRLAKLPLYIALGRRINAE